MSSKYPSGFKFKVAPAALKGDRKIVELCQNFSMASSQTYAWKKDLKEREAEIFQSKNPKR